MRLRDRFRLTRIGLYFYHRRYTLSLTWRIRWHWLPFLERFGFGSWIFGWFRFAIEKTCWDYNDDWGERAAETRLAILEQLVSSEGPLMELEETPTCDAAE